MGCVICRREKVSSSAGQRRGADGGPRDLLEVAGRGVPRSHLLRGHRRVATDGRHDVVEVVRDAAGEEPDEFHLLGFTQLGLQQGPLADIRQHRNDARDGTGLIAYRRRGNADQQLTSRAIEQDHLVVPDRRPLEHARDEFHPRSGVRRRSELGRPMT